MKKDIISVKELIDLLKKRYLLMEKILDKEIKEIVNDGIKINKMYFTGSLSNDIALCLNFNNNEVCFIYKNMNNDELRIVSNNNRQVSDIFKKDKIKRVGKVMNLGILLGYGILENSFRESINSVDELYGIDISNIGVRVYEKDYSFWLKYDFDNLDNPITIGSGNSTKNNYLSYYEIDLLLKKIKIENKNMKSVLKR